MQFQGNIANIASASYGDGTQPTASAGKQGEILTGAAHGDLFNAALRGALFHGSTAAAGVIPPVSSATAATFTLWNAASTGKNLELLELSIGNTTTTLVASAFLLGLVSAAPTSVTAITATIMSGKVGAATPSAALYSAATIVASTNFYALPGYTATSGLATNLLFNLRGGIILPPGYGVHLCGFAAQTAASDVRITWAEWPV